MTLVTLKFSNFYLPDEGTERNHGTLAKVYDKLTRLCLKGSRTPHTGTRISGGIGF